ncbi:tyrosine-type recombinase/integrase [Pleurocapsales cyanobacterium LEGE 10410]|nr:tyrosine-type recombinase/integrase [Pleurocapsales cyanobacterium LEGE 10410]
MYTEGQKKAKIGAVSVDINRGKYRIRFSFPKGKRHYLRIAHVTPEGWATALKTAQLINRDLDLGCFDETYARYSPSHAKALELAQEKKTKTYTLVQLWERYKDLNKDRIAQTTQNHLWKDCDRYLSRTDKNLLELNKAQEFVSYLQGKYAVSTIATLFRSCLNPAVNAAVNAELITVNPYQSINIPKPQKKPIECFEPNEVKAIIAAFYSDEYKHKFSSYEHSFYAQYVEMLALTGARPEEIVALTFDDIKRKGGKTYIKFSKAYSKGILLPHTKTKEIRLFPCNKQLVSVLNSVPKTNKLMFPGVEGGYLNHGNFRKRDWRVVLKGLVEDKKVEKYLKPYALRHSFITRLVREGVDIKTVATLSGNSVATIIKHYLAAKQDFNLPEL